MVVVMTGSQLPHDPTDPVVLVDDLGQPLGTADRLSVHTAETPLHLAFSSYLFDPEGRLLLTRRAIDKLTWAGVWTNSCCGHLRPGEDAQAAADRRIVEELGVRASDLRVVLPDFRYRAVDASGVVENEICPVLVGRIPAELSPDPAEIAEFAFVEWDDFCTAIAATPSVYSPWAVAQLEALSGSHPLATERVSGLTEFGARVDAELAGQFDRLEQLWARFAGSASLDILPVDLPGWARRLSNGGGKRIRIAMTWWGFVAAGGAQRPARLDAAVRVAAALELLHLFALVHDDVMDASQLRRGGPAAQIEAAGWHRAAAALGAADQFGVSIAVLLGDLLHTLADQLAYALPAGLRTRWYELCIELIAGQRTDLTGSAARRREPALAAQVAERKSGGYTILRPLQLGAAAAGADAACLAALERFGVHLGRAFAWRDDELGAWGDPTLSGKPAGDDLIGAKPTVIAALAAARLSPDWLTRLDALPTIAAADEVAAVQAELERVGVRAEVEALIKAEADAALSVLETSDFDPDAVAGLQRAIEQIAWRAA